jgi:hypothetical protein
MRRLPDVPDDVEEFRRGSDKKGSSWDKEGGSGQIKGLFGLFFF